ncbi:hypothetical protein M5K25_006405 [Dendrobium thyrsiflorum]|uniref:Uncharacterized protein n=1 Tax=Dendrobium thyrsiflorum TaxID=117978 RepID=A0ABD0VBT4_DENTH
MLKIFSVVHYLSKYVEEEYAQSWIVYSCGEVSCDHVKELLRRMDIKAELTQALNDWNNEFVKIKYLQGEYKQKYDDKTNKVKTVEEKLVECRAELTTMITSSSLQNQQMETRDHIYAVEVKVLELHCIEEGFIQGFLKGVHLVQRKTGVEVEGLSPS